MILKIKNEKGEWKGVPAITGVGVEAVNKEETASGNVITIVLTDGNETTFVINNGITPHIGTNGNWFIGDTDTGIVADAEIITAGVKAALSEISQLHADTRVARDEAYQYSVGARESELSASDSMRIAAASAAEASAARDEVIASLGDMHEALDRIIALMDEYAPTASLMPDGEETPIV